MTHIRIGDHIGPYVVMAAASRGQNYRLRFVGKCFCGKQKTVDYHNALRDKSCGCKKRLLLRLHRMTHGRSRIYGEETKVHRVWRHMIDRCTNPKNKSFKRYGARGILVCDRWKKFENFLLDMGEPTKIQTLGRINNNIGYVPENCRWETYKQQANNRSNSRLVTFRGETLTIAQWAEKTGLRYETLSARIRSGWAPERALSTAPKKLESAALKFRGL